MPARPSTSPLRTDSDTFLSFALEKFRASRTTSPIFALREGNCSSRLRPTIMRIISGTVVSFQRLVPMYFPSRRTVILSTIRLNSSRRWEIYTIATPCSRSLRSMSNSLFTSCSASAEVGSSSTSTSELYKSAFAISTICISATLREDIFCVGEKDRESESNNSCVFWFIRLSSISRLRALRNSRAAKIFSATVRSGIRLNS